MKLKKAFSIFLVLTLLLGTFALNVSAADPVWVDSTVGYSAEKATPDAAKLEKVAAATDLAGVTALTANSDYKITSVAGLQNFAKLVNEGKNFEGNTVYLANDIDNGGEPFSMEPIGKYTSNGGWTESDPAWIGSTGFHGVFDGCGHTIDYLTMTSTGNGEGIALFGSVMSAEIRNLILGEHCVFANNGTAGWERTAALVAIAQAHSNADMEQILTDVNGTEFSGSYLIENVKSYATVTAQAGYTGGIAALCIQRGTNRYSVFRYLTVSGNTTLEGSGYVSGVVGAFLANAATRPVYVYNCRLDGRLIGTKVDKICHLPVNGVLNSSGHSVLFLETLSPDYDATAKGYSYDNLGERVTTGTNIKDVDTFNTTTNYLISDAAGLKKLATLSASNYFDSVKFYLTADIDMSGVEMTTIGSISKQFVGRFDGQGYVIDNLKITVTDGYAGLFGQLDKAVVKNVVLGDGCYFEGAYAGSVAASVKCPGNGLTEIQNCYSEATVVGKTVAGGMVGYVVGGSNAYGCQLRNLTYAGEVSATAGDAGGILGKAERPVLVAYCRNAGAVAGTANVGALIGTAGNQNKVVYNRVNVLPENGRLIGVRGNSVAPYHDNVIITDGTDNTWDLIRFVGYQTKTEGGTVTAVRLLAVVNDLDAGIGFTLSASDGAQSYTYTADKVYSSVLASAEGVDVAIRAETIGGKYLVAITIAGVPASGTTLTVVPFEGDYTGVATTFSLNVA